MPQIEIIVRLRYSYMSSESVFTNNDEVGALRLARHHVDMYKDSAFTASARVIRRTVEEEVMFEEFNR